MTVNKSRLWWIAEQILGDRWAKQQVGLLAGCVLTGSNALPRLRQVSASDARDLLIFMPEELVILEPKSTAKQSLWGALKGLRGDFSGIAGQERIPRRVVGGLKIDQQPPSGLPVTGSALDYAHVELREPQKGKHQLDFWVDAKVMAPGDIVGAVDEWVRAAP